MGLVAHYLFLIYYSIFNVITKWEVKIYNYVWYKWNIIGRDDDYSSGPYNVKFPAYITNISFNVSITNDNILEQNETFALTFNPAIAGNPSKAVVTIVDDDSE